MSDNTPEVVTEEVNHVPAALAGLCDTLNQLCSVVATVVALQEEHMFRYLSKDKRNELLDAMHDLSADVTLSGKASFKAMKKVRRCKVPEQVVDSLLFEDWEAAVNFKGLVEDEVEDGVTDADSKSA